MRVKAFQGLRPAYELAEEISSVPSESIDAQEASRLTWENPFSILHVLRAEVDLEGEPSQERIFQKARENFEAFKQQELWMPEELPMVYLYQLEGRGGEGAITGVVMEGESAEYAVTDEGAEVDYDVARLNTLKVAFEPVAVVYPDEPFIEMLKGEVLKGEAVAEFTDALGVTHRLWRAPGEAVGAFFERGFEGVSGARVIGGEIHLEASRPEGRFLGVFFSESEALVDGESRLPTLRSGLFARVLSGS